MQQASGNEGGTPVRVLLSLGSNIAPQRHLRAALDALAAHFGAIAVSPAYSTAAVGFDGARFLNNAVALDTTLSLQELEAWLHALEDAHGRDRSGPRLSDRTLDVDVVFYGALVQRDGDKVRIPRPELKHAFVLKPLADIAPDFIDPLTGRTLDTLWRVHPQHAEVFEVLPL